MDVRNNCRTFAAHNTGILYRFMGRYINKGSEGFQSSRNSEYVDKSELIGAVNRTLFTEQRFSCVSRCRRFGKSMAAKMLAAYYDRSCDSRSLFADLKIASDPSFEKHLNKYPVIYLDMTDFVTRYHDEQIVEKMDWAVREDLTKTYPDIQGEKDDDLMDYLLRVTDATGQHFLFIIDEWDAICREFKSETKAMDNYLNWLRRMFKSANAADVFAGVYMTGILPIKKYRMQSAMNNFTEYSMVKPGNMARYFGFTKDEVHILADKYGMDINDLEKWYDGYQIGPEPSMFNPNSVMQALYENWCDSYWGNTGAYDAILPYIQMNYEGLKDNIISLLSGGRVKVNATKFQNDLSLIRSKDDALTVLIHLGYLAYDRTNTTCYVPNFEVAGELANAVEDTGWTHVVNALQQSELLLQSTLNGDAEAVARGIEAVHDENTSILSYSDENSLACVLSIAYYYAKNDYIIHREYASGKGFADLVMIPRKNIDSPAIVVELKCDKDADTAISQIKRRQYPDKVAQYCDNILLVGINYDRKSKTHTCMIERI